MGAEQCPMCDGMNEVEKFEVQKCEHCGCDMLPCSECEYVLEDASVCSSCPLMGGGNALTRNCEEGLTLA